MRAPASQAAVPSSFQALLALGLVFITCGPTGGVVGNSGATVYPTPTFTATADPSAGGALTPSASETEE